MSKYGVDKYKKKIIKGKVAAIALAYWIMELNYLLSNISLMLSTLMTKDKFL